eukprot:m.42365 g.42365  ORF g.42365 m.42365 type:complete len:218 (+) comp15023_c0_seq4:316-969(+)
MASAPVTTTTTTTSTSADGAIRVVTTTTTASSVSTPKTTSPVQEKLHGEVITSGFHFSEGPRFHNGKLYIADMLGFDPESSHTSTTDGVLGDSGFIWEIDVETGNKRRYAAFCDTSPSGLGWLPDGRMIAVATSGGQVRVETKAGSGVFEPYADITPCFTAKTDLLNDMWVNLILGCFLTSAQRCHWHNGRYVQSSSILLQLGEGLFKKTLCASETH